MASLLLGARVLLAAVFVTAGVAKLLDPSGSRRSLNDFGVPGRFVSVGAVLLPLAELATALALLLPQTARWGALAALLLLLAFVAAIARTIAAGEAADCHCFGQLHSAPAGRGTIARNSALAAIAAFVVWEGPGPSISAWASARSATELTAVLAGVAAVVLAAAALQLWRTNRGLRRELDQTQSQLALFPAGLPVGAPAPSFSLASAEGDTVTLEQLLAPGHPVVLVFVDPGCGPCQMFYPELGRWQATLSGSVSIAIISTGTAEENLAAVRDTRATVLLQNDAEVMRTYRVQGTPATVVVTPEGRIASAPWGGAYIGESLIRMTLRAQAQGATSIPIDSPQPVA